MTLDDLSNACEHGRQDDVERALDAGIDINGRDSEGWTPLRAAAAFDRLQIVNLLLARGADVNRKNKDGTTPLFGAARSGNFDIALLLIDNGADVNARDLDGRVPLNEALTNRKSASHTEVIKLLLSNGAQVSVKGAFGRTPLHQAAQNNNVAGARLLLQYDADVNARDDDGNTPLQLHEDEERGDEGEQMQDLLRSAGG